MRTHHTTERHNTDEHSPLARIRNICYHADTCSLPVSIQLTSQKLEAFSLRETVLAEPPACIARSNMRSQYAEVGVKAKPMDDRASISMQRRNNGRRPQ